ncbi:hypothetical protein B0H17DRAFT_1187512 [Mycena rosella]|uniref:Uncharacterized protein n=1 Tax=Mycena rosella TaxID=1033263 RepID=A0AAD7BY91_MYCRO|nr:hypothetical protein B0H17DRAFT_1187512 [Mycena rosella]
MHEREHADPFMASYATPSQHSQQSLYSDHPDALPPPHRRPTPHRTARTARTCSSPSTAAIPSIRPQAPRPTNPRSCSQATTRRCRGASSPARAAPPPHGQAALHRACAADPFAPGGRTKTWTPPFNESWEWAADRTCAADLGGQFVLEPQARSNGTQLQARCRGDRTGLPQAIRVLVNAASEYGGASEAAGAAGNCNSLRLLSPAAGVSFVCARVRLSGAGVGRAERRARVLLAFFVGARRLRGWTVLHGCASLGLSGAQNAADSDARRWVERRGLGYYGRGFAGVVRGVLLGWCAIVQCVGAFVPPVVMLPHAHSLLLPHLSYLR